MAQAPAIGSTVTVSGPISGGVPEWTIGISGPCSATPPQGSPGSPCPAFLHAANMDIQRALQRAQQAAPARVTLTGTVTGVAPQTAGTLAGVPIISVTSVSGAPPGPEPFRVGSVVDITATVESSGPGFYRITMCVGGAPCPAVLMVPGAETQARLNAAQLNQVPADIHGTISSFQPGGTPVITVSSVRVNIPPRPEPQLVPLPTDPIQCMSTCLTDLGVEMSVSGLLSGACGALASLNVPAAGICAGVSGGVLTGEILSCLTRCRIPGFRIPAVLEQLVGRRLTATGGGSGGSSGGG